LPGSSRYLKGGIVAYADRVKCDLLGVGEKELRAHGAVSEVVARAMAEGVVGIIGAEVGIAITGVAGPDGGTPEKPVGTVWFALAVPGSPTQAARAHFEGDRAMIREQAVRYALTLLASLVPGRA
jgi:nicotinamide-nucleotide amidase